MNIFFPKRNVEYDLGKWVNGDKRVLFIAGLSGSGKTTLADELGDLMDAKVIHLDQYLRPLIRAKVDPNPDYEKAFYEHGVRLLLEDNPEGKIIIEGCHIAWFNLDELKEHAVLILNTSFMKSCWQILRRSLSKKNLAKWGVRGIHIPFQFNIQKYSHVRAFSQLI